MVVAWRRKLRENFTSWKALKEFLQLPEECEEKVLTQSSFPLNLPRRFAEKIEKGRMDDPLLLQFLPLKKEEDKMEGFVLQPVEDEAFQKTPRLLQKYGSRVLLVTTSACAMNCRFCFRKNYPYQKERSKDFMEELDLIGNDLSIQEVILSGGDPLSLPNETLSRVVEALNGFSHVKRLRIHTRFSLGIPERIDAELVELLARFRGVVYVVLHINHPKEWDSEAERAHLALRKAGIVLLSQTVLLKGVNDSVETLKELFLGLVDGGVLPYYLHQLDRVEGGAHFEVEREKGMELLRELRALLPGYGIPDYVEEIPHAKSKMVVSIEANRS